MNFFQRLETSITVDSEIRALGFLPDESPRFISGEKSAVQLRSLKDDPRGKPIESSTGVLAVAASKDGRWIVAGTTDGFAIFERVKGGEDFVPMVRHAIKGVRTIDISSDSNWVVTGSDAGTVDAWDISTGEGRPEFGPLKHEYNVVAVKFCPCGERLATATLFGSVRIYATSSGQKLLTIPISVSSSISIPNVTLAWFIHRPQVFAVSQGQIKCLNADDGSVLFQWPLRAASHPSSLALSPNNKIIAYSINDTVILRDTNTRQQIGAALKLDANVSCIDFSPRNDYLVVGADTKFSIWNLRKLLVETSHLIDTSIKPAESCAHHARDTTRKTLPSTFLLPLMSINNTAVKPWLHGFLQSAEQVFSTEIEQSGSTPSHDMLANRALICGRMGDGTMALRDAEKSLCIQTSAIGHIAKTIALIHMKEYALARQEIPNILRVGHSDKHTFLLEVIQSILCCLSDEHGKETPCINQSGEDEKDHKLWLLVQANMYLSRKYFDRARESCDNARVPAIFPHDETPEMWTISFIFGWKFSGLAIHIQQRQCEFLLDAGDSEAAVLFIKVRDTYQREMVMHVELSDWASKFRKDCLKKLEDLGDKALASGDYAEAIRQYTAVEPLMGDQDLKHELLLKRSKAHAEIIPANWSQSLQDAEEAINLNPSSPWGYDRKHVVLYMLRNYREAAEALDQMIVSLWGSRDAKSTELREKGVKPGETRKLVIEVADDTLAQPRPHILINTESGRLCDKQKQMEAFRAHPQYKDLILSPASQVGVKSDDAWKEVVRNYFRYSTFSHTWEDHGEPEFRDVENRSVDSLTESFPHTKLKTLCRKTREHGYLWAWSDTCCINKAKKEVLDVSLRSMYRWYSESSLTIVHLKGVLGQLDVDLDTLLDILDELLRDFVECRWNKRAWTLQEYFASRVIHFYTEDWKPYLPIDAHRSDTNPTNHKEFRAIQRGMELVTGLDAVHLAALKPGSDEVRQKLCLASTREATRREDVAYSLLGIFRVTIEAIYGDDEVPRAFGRLLGALLTQSADVSILAWTGKPSEYNTCLPAEITVYRESESLHIPDPIDEAMLAATVSAMRSRLSSAELDSAVRLHDSLVNEPLPELHHGRLKLPCIWFPLSSDPVVVVEDPTFRSYVATVPMLGQVTIRTSEDLTSERNMILVHPWFRRRLDPGIALSESVRRESALKLLAFLRRPFGALLLARTFGDYKRIAADWHITVQIREEVSAEMLLGSAGVLNIR